MAMTKAEKAEMDNLRAARDMARALRWPEYAEPAKLAVPKFGEFTEGWTFNSFGVENGPSAIERAVRLAWSESICHGDGGYRPRETGRSASQNGVQLFETRADALKAMRLQVTQTYARTLAQIDAAIAAEAARQSAANTEEISTEASNV
ncbi:hypothetical protein [Azospirillum sp. TSA6c]|uniref:hypothetical protein n=1 Tax=Azospirillum sp. TSA6c TaxID=709813 RepID=UPI001FFE66AB|nr:hypothetical protein [Azospirillum sp. TSA6c]